MTQEIPVLPSYQVAVGNTWNAGPDKIMPAESHTSTKLNQPVKLKTGELDLKHFPPLSIYSAFAKTAKAKPDYPALAYKQNHESPWAYFSYSEYWKMCVKAAKSFIKLGLETSECVAILGFNSPHWFISLLGCIFTGGVGCGIYTTNSAEACEYILKDSGSQIVVVENKQQLDKIIKCKQDGCLIKKIIQYSGSIDNNYDGLVMSWREFIDFGNDVNDSFLDIRVKTIAPNKCASLIYTSGTTGIPKAAMISHDCITYLSRYIGLSICQLKPFNEKFISYLPLSHIAAQVIDIYTPITIGITVYFAQPDALKGTLNKTMQEVRPTYFFGVPRVWEKMQESITKEIRNLTGIKQDLFEWSRRVATENINNNFSGSKKSTLSYKIAKALVLKGVLEKLGLDQCRHFFSGAAPITKETLDFFISLGIPLCEAYGMSESTGPHNIGTPYSNRVTSIGVVKNMNKSKLFNKDQDGSGELGIYGRHVFMGYLNDQTKTDDTLDGEGWLHSGDLAKIDEGFIYITGRLKELIITAGGENIPPVPIEDNIKAELPDVISNCMLIGDKRKYLVVLVTLKSKIDLDTMEPMDELADVCIEWLKRNGSSSTKVSQIINSKDPVVYKAIDNAIRRANEKSTSRAAKVQKFDILLKDFSLANGELGPTLKLRRPIVAKMHSKIIEQLYVDTGNSAE